MIDEYEAYSLIQSHEMSYYAFQKWMKEQREDIPKEVWDDIYDRGEREGNGNYQDGYDQGYSDAEEEFRID